MISHILVPLDGSSLAECVLPHVLAIAPSVNAHITLLHVLEPSRSKGGAQTIDPLEWHLKKREAGVYLDGIAQRLREANLKVENVILEGLPADCVIDFAHNHDVTLIILSTHGRSGLSGWNVSSVVQKIILRSFKSTLLVRAYKTLNTEDTAIHYNRLFVGLDCSARAEYILPVAVNFAQFHKAQLILGMVIREPEILDRFPHSEEDSKLVARIVERNHRAASHYLEGLQKRLSLQGVEAQIQLITSDSVTAALHGMVEQQDADLVMLVAHGHSGGGYWPYGSIATSFIAYGTTSLMIMQDLPADEIKQTIAEIAARESKGH
jgi:nucleotide-binding universal stress UspA family protein